MSSSVNKIVAERNHRILVELVSRPGNDSCADCKARAPRWASHNLGIFICMNCASIHRKIGTHITKVKSITLDEWTKEQVEVMKENGNAKSNALYNPNEARHPPPTNMMDSERDSELEKFIRSKYQFKRFMDRKSGATSQPNVGDSRATSTALRSRSTPLTDALQIGRKTSPGPPLPPKTPENMPPSFKFHKPPTRSASQPLPPLSTSGKLVASSSLRPPAATQLSAEKPSGPVWEDLISLQGPSQQFSLPLQYSPMASIPSLASQPQVPVQQQPTTLGSAPNPFSNLSLGQSNATGQLVASPISVATPDPQFHFVPTGALPSPGLHLGMLNPFNHVPYPSSPGNGTTFSTNSNPFSSSHMPLSMSMSTPSTPSAQPMMTLPALTLPHTPPLPYVPSQMSTPSFQSTPFFSAPIPATAGLVQNPYMSIGPPMQVPLGAPGSTNPFTAMQMRQVGFAEASPQSATGATPFFNQQQQPGAPHAFGGWAGQGGQGSL